MTPDFPGTALGWLKVAGPGLAVAAALFALVLIGYRVGRRRRPSGLAELERGIHALARGELDKTPEVRPGDAAAPAAALLADLARRLREQQAHGQRRSSELAEALEAMESRGLLLLDRDFVVVTASEGVARMVGERVADVETRSLQDLLSPESFRQFAALAAETRRRRGAFACDLLLRRGASSPVAAAGQAAWLADPPDALALFVEREAGPTDGGEPPRAAMERRAAVFDGLADGVLVVREGTVLEANPQARGWLGENLAGAPLKDLLAAEDLLLVLDRVGRAERGETVGPVLSRMLPLADPSRSRDVELFAAAVQFGGRGAAALTLRDLGPEQHADRRARLHEARLLAVLDAVGEGLTLLAPPAVDGAPWRVGLINRRLLEVLGLDAAHVLGAPEDEFRALAAHRFAEPASFAALLSAGARAPRKEHHGTFELTGEGGVLDLVLRPVLGLDDQLLGRMVVARDVTRHRDAEKQLVADAAALGRSRESLQKSYEQLTVVNRDLERKSAELDRLNRELVELDRARAQLLADVSHELNTPLVSIRGYTQMIIEGRLGRINDEQRRGLEVALRNIDRMVELINNLLSLARSESGAPVHSGPVDPAAVIAEVMERHQEAARRKNVKLEAQIDDPGAHVAAEREGLIQVLDNLVSNGIKFNRTGGRVLVSVRPARPGFVKLEVSDTGIGIPREEQAQIFERFYRGRAAAGTSGAGIGLATVRNIVVRHGGAVELESTAGEGTVFRVLWPRSPSSLTGTHAPGVTAVG